MGSSSSRHVLSARDAWRIALAWRDELQGCVRLETTAERLPHSIIPTFEWVTFVFNGTHHDGFQEVRDPQKTAAYARAAATVWFALSCCEGYSAAENPVFWKLVFFELLYPKDLPGISQRPTNPSRQQIPITDAVRFFDDPHKPFPRIKLVPGEYDHNAAIQSVFLGSLHHEDKKRDKRLQRLLTKLHRYIRVTDTVRRVPVEIELQAPPMPGILQGSQASGVGMKPHATVSVDFPQLFLQSVALISSTLPSSASLDSLLPPSDVQVYMRGHFLSRFVHKNRLASGLLDQLHDNSPRKNRSRWHIANLRVMQNSELSFSYLGVLCSALPHLQSISSLMVPRYRYNQSTPNSIASDWAWLGYAIFHPDAASTSGCNSLEVDLGGVTPDDIAALASMSVGNNLLADTNTGYVEGRVQCGAQAWANPESEGEASFHKFIADSWVPLCFSVAGASDICDGEDWVCAVIPGFGSGWIRTSAIIETRSRRPGVSCILSLGVNEYSNSANGGANEAALLGILRVLGSRLNSLHFSRSEPVPASTLHAILRLCPSLSTLRIKHDGSFWANEENAIVIPRLKELELSITTANGQPLPLHNLNPACLPDLRALRVVASNEDKYQEHTATLLSFISNQPTLQYLYWTCEFKLFGTWGVSPYGTNEPTRIFLEQLANENKHSVSPIRLDCRLAFLSVIELKAARGSVDSLGEDVVSHIFQYATSTGPLREIRINP